ncbi:MAG TPA: hypothetical protein VHC97_16240 [Thermoanaerobaculia bacterium]|jgi:hypothetical protein|nr:hypothetical protein [Thermoanaerobaculia bacterium]
MTSFLCRHKLPGSPHFCASDRPSDAPCGAFEYTRIERPEDLPPADPRIVDVAVLDMNHGWPNLGHDSLVHALLDTACELLPIAEETGVRVRALSFDVRRAGMIPEPPGGRFSVYLGTGGPGHLDPHENDGASEFSQGIHEDPSWQAPLYRLFDRVVDDDMAALLAVCHTFGVMCHWSGLARPVLRGPEKGGKSTGVLENVLAPEAQEHPWFQRFGEELDRGERLRILDNRLFDLIPDGSAFPSSTTPIGWETLGVGGPPGDAITMLEFARDTAGAMPRVFGVNHHPEIVDRARQLVILEQKLERGEVDAQWVAERREVLTRTFPDEDSDVRLQRTSNYTLLGPLRFHLWRQMRLRLESLGHGTGLHEDRAAQALPVVERPPSRLPVVEVP